MQFNPRATNPAGRGKFDVVLMACYGIFRYIQSQGFSSRVKVHAINFSDASRSSSWHPCTSLEPVKRTLAAYQGHGTRLDVDTLRQAVADSPGKFLAIAMTDGGLKNTQEVIAELRRMLAAGHRLVHLHIGPANAFTKGVEELGCPVHLLKDANDLVGLCLDLAKSNYGKREG